MLEQICVNRSTYIKTGHPDFSDVISITNKIVDVYKGEITCASDQDFPCDINAIDSLKEKWKLLIPQIPEKACTAAGGIINSK